MADQTIAIRLILRDELSRPLADIQRQIDRLAGANLGLGRNQFVQFGGAVRAAHRELSTLARLSVGGLIGGGVVASIVGVSKALGDMARQGLQLRYQAEALRVSPQFLERMTDGLTALGESASEASSSVKNAIEAFREAEVKGTESALFKRLEKGVRGTGVVLWRQLREQLRGPDGAEGAFRWLVERMRTMHPTGQRALMQQLGLSSLAFKDLQEVLPQLHKRLQLPREEMLRLNIANTNFEIAMGNIGRQLGAAVMPGLAKVTKALSDWLQTNDGKEFAKQVKEWSDSLGSAVAKWIKEGGLKKEVDALKQVVKDIKEAFAGADEVIKAIGEEWTDLVNGLAETGFVQWLHDVAEALGLINKDDLEGKVTLLQWAADLIDKLLFNQRTRGDEIIQGPQTVPVPPNLAIPPRFVPQGVPKPQPQSGEGQPKTEQERRADMQEEKNQRELLKNEFALLTDELKQINQYIPIGGPQGTADGSSGYGAGVSGADLVPGLRDYILGPAGGGPKNRPLPQLPFLATALSRLAGTPRPAQTSGLGFASWYGNRPDLGFVDREDRGRQGVSERDQGIALGTTAGLGNYHYLSDPHTGLTHVVKQTDTGPNIRTQKLLDIHASQLARMGYTAKSFPSGRGLWGVQPTGFEKWDPGRGGAMDEGESNLLRQLAPQSSRVSGNATVDIDVGGLSEPARDPSSLFRPQPLEGSVQMQNATHAYHNPLSYQ